MKKIYNFLVFFLLLGSLAKAQTPAITYSANLVHDFDATGENRVNCKMAKAPGEPPIIVASFKDSLVVPLLKTKLYTTSIASSNSAGFGIALFDMDTAGLMRKSVVATCDRKIEFTPAFKDANGLYRIILYTDGALYTNLGLVPLLHQRTARDQSRYELVMNDAFTVIEARCLVQFQSDATDTFSYFVGRYSVATVNPFYDAPRNRIIMAERAGLRDSVRFLNGPKKKLYRQDQPGGYPFNKGAGSYIYSRKLGTNTCEFVHTLRADFNAIILTTVGAADGSFYVGGMYYGNSLVLETDSAVLQVLSRPLLFEGRMSHSFMLKFSAKGKMLWALNLPFSYNSAFTSLRLADNDKTLIAGGSLQGLMERDGGTDGPIKSDPNLNPSCPPDIYTSNEFGAVFSAATGKRDTIFSVTNKDWNMYFSGSFSTVQPLANGDIVWGGVFSGAPYLFSRTPTTAWNTYIWQCTNKNLQASWSLKVGGPVDGATRVLNDSHYDEKTGELWVLGSVYAAGVAALGIPPSYLVFNAEGQRNGFWVAKASGMPLSSKSVARASSLSIYPNPALAGQSIRITSKAGTYQLIDNVGRQAALLSVGYSSEATLPQGLSPGLYTLVSKETSQAVRLQIQ